jgi:hypothetical protein
VVATFSKLQPAELLYYLENLHRFPKANLIRDIRQNHPGFELDIESLSSAIARIDAERCIEATTTSEAMNFFERLIGLPPFTNASGMMVGGILDLDDAEAEVDVHGIGEMTGLGLDWRPEDLFGPRREMLRGVMDPP